MKIQLSIHCDNNGGPHFEELGAWELSDVDDLAHAKDTLEDLVDELHRKAIAEGWALIQPERDGWTRVLCGACCAKQGGG